MIANKINFASFDKANSSFLLPVQIIANKKSGRVQNRSRVKDSKQSASSRKNLVKLLEFSECLGVFLVRGQFREFLKEDVR